MIDLLMVTVSLFSDQERTDFIQTLNKVVKEKLTPLNRRKQNQRMSSLLALSNYFELNNLPYSVDSINYSNKGKPFLNEHIKFNFAYAEDKVLIGISNVEIGVDIESIRPMIFEDFKIYLTETEIDHLLKLDDNSEQITYYWTRKEALSKALGLGSFVDFRTLDVVKDSLRCHEQDYQLESFKYANYWISFAYNCESKKNYKFTNVKQ